MQNKDRVIAGERSSNSRSMLWKEEDEEIPKKYDTAIPMESREFVQCSTKKKKRKSSKEENRCIGMEDPTADEILNRNESFQSLPGMKKRRFVNSAVENNRASGAEHLTSSGILRDDESIRGRSMKKNSRKWVTRSNLIYSGDSLVVSQSDDGVTSCENVLPPTGITITKQPGGKYVVGSLSRLFSGDSVASSAEDRRSGGTIIEGETVIKPKKQKKDINDNAIESKDVDVHKKSFRTKDRTQQRANRKRAREERMGLEEKKRTIFVGNAPLTMDEKSCKKLFSHYGKIESVRMRCIFPCKETVSKRIAHISRSFHEKQTSLIFYVKFKDEESVQKALAYNGTVLDRHRIRVDTCTSKAQYDRKLTVFVGNIPLDANEDDLANLFEENIGDVSFVRCVKDQLTGMGKGFAFVVFKSPTSVQLALSATGLHFQERELRIMKVMKKREIAKLQSTKKGSQAVQNLTKEQSTKIDQYKFSTRKSEKPKPPPLTKKARKAIQRKKAGSQVKSFMQ